MRNVLRMQGILQKNYNKWKGSFGRNAVRLHQTVILGLDGGEVVSNTFYHSITRTSLIWRPCIQSSQE